MENRWKKHRISIVVKNTYEKKHGNTWKKTCEKH